MEHVARWRRLQLFFLPAIVEHRPEWPARHRNINRRGTPLSAPGTAVLVVDDDADITRFIGAVLRSRGHRTISAYDAADGFQVAQRQQPKLILVDWHMPRGGGPELLRQLRADQTTAAIPVVVVTNDSAPNIRDEAVSLGAKRFLHKPLDPDRLADIVSSMVGVPDA